MRIASVNSPTTCGGIAGWRTAPSTIANRTLHEFLALVEKARLRLKSLTVANVNDLLAKKIHEHGFARTTIHRWASVLRPFFGFAERRKWCRRGLAAGIRAPRLYKHEGLPVGPSWDDVKRLPAAAEGDRPTDIRDRAMLMLLAIYGLRAGEVVTLRLEDFDWKREMLAVPRGKGQKPRTYPLCRPVGDAVLRYLCEVRPRTGFREVFLTRIAISAGRPGQPNTCAAALADNWLRKEGAGLSQISPPLAG
jgi:integrase/recombinase XerD